ncbi:MAG: histone methyltransferase set1 [Chrysothrix sp. TS-e1954]|nr:MAG: histone methyltransferase set1 [Chrysothrix sp. TS-e1954]
MTSSRPGSFAGFFPTAPSVQQQKRKRGPVAQDTVASPLSSGFDARLSESDTRTVPSSHVKRHESRFEGPGDSRDTVVDVDDKFIANGEVEESLNGVGSAGSHSTTVSSVFSNGGVNGMASHNSLANGTYSLTPLTNHDSSPPRRLPSPSYNKYRPDSKPPLRDSLSKHSSVNTRPMSPPVSMTTPNITPPHDPVKARPGKGESKGERAVYDPELDQKLSSKERRKLRPRYRSFGEAELAPPPDPRLALAGYKSGDLDIRLKDGVKIWKQKRREAPSKLPPYQWDSRISIGLGPATGVVVTGFDPLIPEAQIRALFGSFGDVQSLEKKTDPNTGSFLSVCVIGYKDGSQARGNHSTAIDAARRAEKEGSGQRIGLRSVRVELDRTGKRCQHYVDVYARRKQVARARTQVTEPKADQKPPPPPEPLSDSIPAPPPNAPKGPSGRPSHRPAELPSSFPPTRPLAHNLEPDPVLPSLKRKPYIFISTDAVPAQGSTIHHMKKRLKSYEWREIRYDKTGYFIIFEDSKRGEDEAVRTHKACNMNPLFNYTMVMKCQEYGDPSYERSPSPARAAEQKRERDEQERVEREEELDLEEEKKQRAEDLDPVLAALEIFKNEVRDKVMSDLKARIAVPTLYDHLEPSKHVAKRRKLGITDPSERSQAPLFLAVGSETPAASTPSHRRGASGSFRKTLHAGSIGLSRRDHEIPRQREPTNAFIDERRQRKVVKPKAAARPLHHRLHDFYRQEESDDEEKRSSREDTKDQDSRSLSRASSMAPSTVADTRRIDLNETPQADESGDDTWGVAKTLLDPHLLKKDPEDMALQELHQVISTLPLTSRLRKSAKRELDIRVRNKDDDRLFQIKSDEIEQTKVEEILTHDIILSDAPEDVTAQSKMPKKKAKAKKKSKKQIFEEREAAKVAAHSAKSLLQSVEAPTPETIPAEDLQIDQAWDTGQEVEDEEAEEEEPAPEVEWGVSADVPRRTVQDDDEDFVLDIDGWQHLVKDDEDLTFLRRTTSSLAPAQTGDQKAWAFQQKQIKLLNNGGIPGLTKDHLHIQGYFVPNSTGCARTEGVQKILESEKSKYLPHRIKVVRAREKREAEAEKDDPLAKAEAVRKAKVASSATSRSNRASNRTQIKDLNVVKQSLTAEGQQSDAIRFNQLKKRKKPVKFDRSAIHGWGLYAEENIAMSEMIIEYVGEKVRQAVANIREIRYDKQGMGSSYLFRIDEDAVVDATKKGGIARFINHSCEPNCTAKIIKVDGTKRIVIYALKDIARNEELTYDYKFDREMDSEDRVPCLCGSATCKKFLN